MHYGKTQNNQLNNFKELKLMTKIFQARDDWEGRVSLLEGSLPQPNEERTHMPAGNESQDGSLWLLTAVCCTSAQREDKHQNGENSLPGTVPEIVRVSLSAGDVKESSEIAIFAHKSAR